MFGSDTSVSLGTGVTLEPRIDLQATARLTTIFQPTRDAGQTLPLLLLYNTRPFQFTESRGVDPGLSALELKIADTLT